MNAENESVVAECIDEVNMVAHTKTPFNTSPTVLPVFVADIESESASLFGKAMRFLPSSRNCGCFIATVSREVRLRISTC